LTLPGPALTMKHVLGHSHRVLIPRHSVAMSTTSPFKVWKTITLGTCHKTADDFRTAFQAAGCYIADGAHDILGSAAFRCADQESELDFVVRSVADLGFRASASYQNICARARELGLELCPAEVGPQLRLQYLNQPFTHWLQIAMEPLIHSSGRLVIFSIDRGEKELLQKRGIIETVNDQLQEQMNIDETLARSHTGLFSRIQAAMLAFTFGIYHNFINELPLLAIKSILI
jgi:hypothetical protein